MDDCGTLGVTGDALKHLRGIYELDLSYCVGMRRATFVFLQGIRLLNLRHCCFGIDRAAFMHLKGVRRLCIHGSDKNSRHASILAGFAPMRI